MSILFEPMNLGSLPIKNRFVRSATYEAMAAETGEVTDGIIKKCQQLAKGEVGLIIPGYFYVHPLGRAYPHQAGIHNDAMMPGLKRLTAAVHQRGGKIAFQLAHAGRQTTRGIIGQTPLGPSARGRDPANFVKPKAMTEAQIMQVIQAFGRAAERAAEAGADAVQLHAAHGYLINQFISPFFNTRRDAWGGSDEKRFRFLQEIVLATKQVLPPGMPLLVKLSTNDHTPQAGITPPLAAKYAAWLAGLGIDGLELSCGSAIYSTFNMCRGDVPVNELVGGFPWWKKPLAAFMLKRMVGKYNLEEEYNLAAAKMVKPAAGDVPLLLVGGVRRVAHMEETLNEGYADFISMSRPFIREPFLVKRIKDGKTTAASCTSCNRCVAAVANDTPVRCFRV